MIVDDLDVVGIPVHPDGTDPPPVADADAAETFAGAQLPSDGAILSRNGDPWTTGFLPSLLRGILLFYGSTCEYIRRRIRVLLLASALPDLLAVLR